MKRSLLTGVVMLLCLGVAGILWFSRTSPPPPTISFIGFRETPEGRVAAFRATNPASSPVAYWGRTASEPYLWYLKPEGDRWETCLRTPAARYLAGTFTLEPHSSVDFVVAPPAPDAAPVTLMLKGSAKLRARLKPPISPESFAVAITFVAGDAATIAREKLWIGARIRASVTEGILEGVQHAANSDWIYQSTYYRIADWLQPSSDTAMWIESDPADP